MPNITLTTGVPYTISVGDGGAKGQNSSTANPPLSGYTLSTNGGDSSISGDFGTVTAKGGGAGGCSNSQYGQDGGGGGGGGGYGTLHTGGISNQSTYGTINGSTVQTFGYAGGTSNYQYGGGGGGGAIQLGSNGSNTTGANGGYGYNFVVPGMNFGYFGSGGGGGSSGSTYSATGHGSGGLSTISNVVSNSYGSGGYSGSAATDGRTGYGGGGGGGSGYSVAYQNGGNGGSGTVIIVILNTYYTWNIPRPWGAYIGNYYSGTTWYDYTGNGNHATMTSGVTTNTAITNGSFSSVSYVSGNTTDKITWPIGSIPSTYTICSISSYKSGSANNGRILVGSVNSGVNWLHGHHGTHEGVAYYGAWNTQSAITAISPNTNWVVMCGKNVGSTPNNILANSQPIGTVSGGTGGITLCVNDGLDENGNNSANEQSDFQVSQVMIWDTALTDASMTYVSTVMQNYLNTGQMICPWLPSITDVSPSFMNNTYFYRNSTIFNIDIAQPIGKYQSLFKYVTSTNVSGKLYYNNIDIFSPILKTSYSDFGGGISETQNTSGYLVNGVDISEYSIAPYIDSISYPNGISNTNIPAWCTAIRVIMIGAGGSGGQAQFAPQQQTDNHQNDLLLVQAHGQQSQLYTIIHEHVFSNQQQNSQGYGNHTAFGNPLQFASQQIQPQQIQISEYGINNQSDNQYNANQSNQRRAYQAQHNHNEQNDDNVRAAVVHRSNTQSHLGNYAAGGGGGGGAFVYISSLSTQTYSQFQLSYSSPFTNLKLNTNYTIQAKDGGSGGVQGAGLGGSILNNISFTNLVVSDGQIGQNGITGNTGGGSSGLISNGYTTQLSYGSGGAGGTSSNTSGVAGQGHYYRVYFLSS
jgi:hypothetical protein